MPTNQQCAGVVLSSWRVRVRVRSGRFERSGVVLTDIEGSSEKKKLCDC